MIIRNNNQNEFKGTTLRGFNNTIENIKKQMETAKDPWQKNKKTEETPKPQFDPQKQKETMIKMEKLNGGSR